MKNASRILGLPALSLALVLTTGCSRTPSRVKPLPIDASAAGTAAIDQYDANRNGKIDAAELKTAPGLFAALGNLDSNGDKAGCDKSDEKPACDKQA